MNRRTFLKSLLAGAVTLGIEKVRSHYELYADFQRLTILHTNDVHSQIDPFPANHHRFPNMGGFARRAAIIQKIRKEEPNVILFDAGDHYQGTPYFNFYHGEVETRLMSEMKYDAATIGNHEFDNGLEGIARNLQFASFPYVVSNYDFSDTMLNGKILKYTILHIHDIRVGVFGLGIELKGLVQKKHYGNTRYLDPLETAAYYARFLKKEMKCHLVICLSHLGFRYEDKKISDIILAKQSKNIDIIIGGHTHTLLEKGVVVGNSDRKPVLITQAGYSGVYLGRIDLLFSRKLNIHLVDCNTIKISKKQV